MTGIGPFTMQVLIPSMPALAGTLGASPATVQLTLTLYLLGIAAGQLVYGPLSDRFGRRPMLLVGMAVYLAASLAAAVAPSIYWLLPARIAQALGACTGVVLGRAIVRDAYPRDRAASIMGYVLMAMTIAPMLAPLLGSVLDVTVGWRATMLACFAFGAALTAAVVWRLPETLAVPQALPGLTGMLRAYVSLVAIPAFRAYAAITACTTGVFFAFMAGAPFVVVSHMGYSPTAYALAFALVSIAYAGGNFCAGRVATRIGVPRLLSIGTVIGVAGAVASLAVLALAPPHILAFFLPMAAVAFGNGMTQPSAIAGAVSANPRLAGTASGLVGALQMGFGALMTVVVGLAEQGSGIATAATMAGSGLAAMLALRAVRKAEV